MAFDLLWRFDAKKKKTKTKTKKTKQTKQNKTKTKAKKKKKVCLFDIRYSFRFERFIIPLRIE